MQLKKLLSGLPLVTLTFLLSCSPAKEQSIMPPFSTPEIDTKVESIMEKMTLPEKLVQIEGIRM